MIEALIAIIMSLAGLSQTDLHSQNPEDYGQWYDQAKQVYYDDLESKEKDGGNTVDTISGS